MLNYKLTVYVITNLKACYNHQLSNVYGMIEELVGVCREGVKLIAKALLELKYYIYTRFSISKQLYRSYN